mgnify:CR=1 FL=1
MNCMCRIMGRYPPIKPMTPMRNLPHRGILVSGSGTVSEHSSGSSDLQRIIALPELIEQIRDCLRRCRRYDIELTVLRLSPDAALPEKGPGQAAIVQTLLSISRLRAARLYRLGPEEYLAVFAGELPRQARRIAEVYRQSIVDLDIRIGGQPLTFSIGMCSGPANSNKGSRDYLECARARLETARQLGGNRVEA